MTPARARLAGLVVAALAAASGLVGLSSAPAAASAGFCSGSGVNVVVDFQGLGGGVKKYCDPKGAGKAAKDVFPAAGVPLDYAARQPGFVCRVQHVPQSDPCQNTSPANATWGLYWSDGTSGSWSYSTKGVGGLSVPDGGFLAFSWQNGSPEDPPGTAPVNRQTTPTKTPTKAAPKPTRTPKPAPKSTKAPKAPKAAKPTNTVSVTGGALVGATTGTSTPTPSSTKASPSTVATAPPTSASASESAAPSETLEPTPDLTSTQKVDNAFVPEDEPSGLPAWVPVSVILVLALVAFGGLWWRNRSSPS
jgi:hypothetical protein